MNAVPDEGRGGSVLESADDHQQAIGYAQAGEPAAAPGPRAVSAVPRPPGAEILHRGPGQLIALQQSLHAATSVSGLLTRASNLARAECGFEVAAILAHHSHRLTADRLDPLEDPDSDALRRRVLADPVQLPGGSLEAEFLRMASGGRGRANYAQGDSVMAERYGLRNVAVGGMAPHGDVLALLVLGREHGAVTIPDQVLVQGFCQLVTYSLERLVLSRRMTELEGELQYMMSSCRALLTEAVHAPITLPADHGSGPVFAQVIEPSFSSVSDLTTLLTRRELSIAKEIIAGKSNPEIARALQLSPDTVKQYVSRIMRKVGAANRAEAAVRCMQLGESAA